MQPATHALSPIAQAEQARQVVGVLSWIERRFAAGAWDRGARFGSEGGVCLIGGIDEASKWTQQGVAEEVTAQLVRNLPAPIRALGRLRPRLALALYNDLVGGRRGATRLVQTTRHALGGVSPIAAGPASSRQRAAVPPPAGGPIDERGTVLVPRSLASSAS